MVNITSESEHYLEALDSFKRSIQRHGPEKTIHILKSAQVKRDDNALLINHIVSVVLTEWKAHKLTKTDLLKRGNRGEPVVARDTVIYLISQTTILSNKEIAYHLNSTIVVVRRAIKKYTSLNIESKVDCKVIERNAQLLKKVLPFIKNKK